MPPKFSHSENMVELEVSQAGRFFGNAQAAQPCAHWINSEAWQYRTSFCGGLLSADRSPKYDCRV
jgi:hypothetical protein